MVSRKNLPIWLAQRIYCVALDGSSSNYMKVELATTMDNLRSNNVFAIINDIKGISSSLRLFMDNCILYRIISSDQDQRNLQSGLNLIFA